jgi:hypothetical protein
MRRQFHGQRQRTKADKLQSLHIALASIRPERRHLVTEASLAWTGVPAREVECHLNIARQRWAREEPQWLGEPPIQEEAQWSK